MTPSVNSNFESGDIVSLIDLISEVCSVEKGLSIENVLSVFRDSSVNFLAVTENRKYLGLVSRIELGKLMSSKFGFEVYSRKSVETRLMENSLVLESETPVEDALKTVFSRSQEFFYDDVAVIDQSGKYIGMIELDSLIKLQNNLLERKLETIRKHEQLLTQMNEKLKEARDSALMATKIKSEFLANMSHELRTPLNGVIGMMDLLLETPLNEDQMYFASTVVHSAESLISIINDILDFSKIEAGRVEIHLSEIYLMGVIDSSIHQIVAKSNQKNLELLIDIHPGVEKKYFGDPIRIQQIIVNLLGNAVKFTDEGNILLKVFPLDNISENRIRFEIHDTGIGINSENQATLFEPFIQVDGSSMRSYGGTGLGLSICRKLTELMGGEIGLISEIGAGSVFWFEIPLIPIEVNSDQQVEFRTDLFHVLISENSMFRNIIENQYVLYGISGAQFEFFESFKSVMSNYTPEQLKLLRLFIDSDKVSTDTRDSINRFCSDKGLMKNCIYVLLKLGNTYMKEFWHDAGFTVFLYKPFYLRQVFAVLEPKPGIYPGEGIMNIHSSVSIRDNNENEQMTILLVEDNLVNLALARIFLERMGHIVECCENGLAALEKLREKKYDCILMDCMMPKMDGYEATSFIRSQNDPLIDSGVYIIAMTANAMIGDREKCIESGMDDYISKPLSKKNLAKALNVCLFRKPT